MNRLSLRTLLDLRRSTAKEIQRLKNSDAKLRRANSELREQIRYLTATLKTSRKKT
jgi:hypothetical protein